MWLTVLGLFLRLVGAMAMLVFFMATVYVYVGDGPLWAPMAAKEERTCSQNGWLSLLMISNYVDPENMVITSYKVDLRDESFTADIDCAVTLRL